MIVKITEIIPQIMASDMVSPPIKSIKQKEMHMPPIPKVSSSSFHRGQIRVSPLSVISFRTRECVLTKTKSIVAKDVSRSHSVGLRHSIGACRNDTMVIVAKMKPRNNESIVTNDW